MTLRFLGAALVMSGLWACGGSIEPVGDGGPDGSPQGDSQPDTNDSFACGTTTCSGDSVCVHPCCGGAPPPCEEPSDAGVCPPGTMTGGYCPTGCTPIPCTPPPDYCAPANEQNGCAPQMDSHDCYQACA